MRAVNLVAFMNTARVPEYLPLWLVLREIVTEQVVQPVKGKPGHDALFVRDDVSAERWQAIVEIIRRRLKKNQFLLYEKMKGRWRRV